MSWTDERVSLLKKLWTEGKSAAEIAKALGGVTRNAVIGKAHRLKLSNRASPIQQNKKPAAAPAAPRQTAAAQEKKIRSILDQDRDRKAVSMMEMNPQACRWPLGDPKEAGFGFCGASTAPGFPYCADHARVAYQPAARNRVMRPEDFEERATAHSAHSAEDDVAPLVGKGTTSNRK